MPWVIVFLFIKSSNESIIQLLAPIMVDYYGITKAKISIIITAAGLITVIGGTIVPVLTQKFSMRQMFGFGIILFNIGTLISFLVHPWYVLFALSRIIQCVGAVSA